MTGLEALQSVQYVTVKKKRLAVVAMEDWEGLIEWLETLEDIQIAKQFLTQLKTHQNNRQRAGWLLWDEVKAEL